MLIHYLVHLRYERSEERRCAQEEENAKDLQAVFMSQTFILLGNAAVESHTRSPEDTAAMSPADKYTN